MRPQSLIKSATLSPAMPLKSAHRAPKEIEIPENTLNRDWSRTCLSGMQVAISQWLIQIEKGNIMTKRLKFASLTLLVSSAALFAPAARADEWNKQTVMTFNAPFEIPGKVLQAGTYVFRLADNSASRDVVQIFTEDQQHLVTTILAIPDSRLEPADGTVVTFQERPSGSPEALQSWFYPGETDGLRFVYPKSESQVAGKSAQPATPAPAPAPQQPVGE